MIGNDADAPPPLPASRAWFTVGVLLLAYVFSIMDRQILTLLVGPIQRSLGVNDTAMGLLHGFTFAAFYAVMSLAIARKIDSGDRPAIISAGIALWSLSTAAGGLATEYWHLVIARIGVAAGEGVLIPGAVSLLADLFPPDRRGRAMGIFGVGGPLGAGLGLLVSGALLGLFAAAPPTLPFLGAVEPWQATLVAVGLPGLAVALLLRFAPEPRRFDAVRRAQAPRPPLSSTVDFLKSHGRTFSAILLGAGALYFAVYGWIAWTPTYFVRELGWSYPQIGKAIGVAVAVGGPVGVLGGAILADWLQRKGFEGAKLRVGVISCAGMAVASAGTPLAGSSEFALIFVTVGAIFSFTMVGVGPAIIQEAAPAPMRGQMAALFTAVLNVIGAGFGPVAVGAITDYLLRDPAAIGVSIATTCAFASLLGLLLFRSGLPGYDAAIADATDWRGAAGE